jgi:hypothetical protein
MDSRIKWDSHHGPAVNVKDHTLYSFDLPEDEAQAIYEDVQHDFWAQAEDIAKAHGYAGIYSEGRMGGWLVPYYTRSYARYSNLELYVADHLHRPDDKGWREEVAKFERFGAKIVALLDACIEDLRAELKAAVEEHKQKAALLEQGTPGRGF